MASLSDKIAEQQDNALERWFAWNAWRRRQGGLGYYGPGQGAVQNQLREQGITAPLQDRDLIDFLAGRLVGTVNLAPDLIELLGRKSASYYGHGQAAVHQQLRSQGIEPVVNIEEPLLSGQPLRDYVGTGDKPWALMGEVMGLEAPASMALQAGPRLAKGIAVGLPAAAAMLYQKVANMFPKVARVERPMRWLTKQVRVTPEPWKPTWVTVDEAARVGVDVRGGKPVDVLINPTQKEIDQLFVRPDSTFQPELRFMVDDAKNLYVWDGNKSFHVPMLRALGIPEKELQIWSDYTIPADEFFDELKNFDAEGGFGSPWDDAEGGYVWEGNAGWRPGILDHLDDAPMTGWFERAFPNMRGGAPKTESPPTIKLDTQQVISSRLPTAVKATEKPEEDYLQIGLEAMKLDPQTFKKNVALVTSYPNYRPMPGVTSPTARSEAFIEDLVGNLLFLHDQIPEATRLRSAKWYDGTGKIIYRFERSYPGLDHRQYAGVISVLSPQKDWYMNASLAERVLSTKLMFGQHQFDDAMALAAERIPMNQAAKAVVRNVVGRRLDELDNPIEQAWWIRLFDEAHNPRSYNVISPEGDLMDLARLADGTPRRVAWGSAGEIGKAVSIIEDGSLANVSRMVGGAHKVRSFFNNIADPMSELGDVTIDTHAVAAALLRPLSGNSDEVLAAFGSGGGASNNSIWGTKGTYGLFAEAYRRAAAQRGLLPRQMQSITWEAVRGLFPSAMKRNDTWRQSFDRIWSLYRNKAITIDEARNGIIQQAEGINPPEWEVPGAGLYDRAQDAVDAGGVPVAGVVRPAQGVNRRAGTPITPSVQEAGLPGRKAVATARLRADVDGGVEGRQSSPFRRTAAGNRVRDIAQYELSPIHVENLRLVGKDAPPVVEISGLQGAQDFARAVGHAKGTNTYGAQVTQKTIKEYLKLRLFMTPDGKAGFAINPKDGDIVSLFNAGDSPHESVSTALVMLAIDQGGRKLDNYDTFLTGIYKKLGFEEYQRFPWDEAEAQPDWDKEVFKDFNNGEPDYLFMEYRPTNSLIERLAKGGKLGTPEEVIPELPPEVVSRFDDELLKTLR